MSPKTDQDIPTESDDYEAHIAGDTGIINVDVDIPGGGDKDLTNAEITFALAEYAGGTPVVEKDNVGGGGVTITDAQAGQVQITLDPSDTEGLGDSDGIDYYYEVEATDQNSNVSTTTTGNFTIQADTA